MQEHDVTFVPFYLYLSLISLLSSRHLKLAHHIIFPFLFFSLSSSLLPKDVNYKLLIPNI
jgi:hypothetical protein